MAYPKWKYRRHPDLGFFQSTLVADADAEAEIGPSWSDDARDTGFIVSAARQLHPTHITDVPLYEVMTDLETGVPLEAAIASVTTGDIHG